MRLEVVCADGRCQSKWVIGRRELPLSHHGATILSDQVERKEMNKVRTSSVVNRQRLALEPLQSVNAVTPNPKLRSACATDPSSKTANTTDTGTREPLFAPNGAALLFATVALRYDACLLINTWIQPVTNEADVL